MAMQLCKGTWKRPHSQGQVSGQHLVSCDMVLVTQGLETLGVGNTTRREGVNLSRRPETLIPSASWGGLLAKGQ